MIPSLLSLLSDDLQTLLLSLWLDVRSLATLDVAVSSHVLRPSWMRLLKSLRSSAIDKWGHGLSSLMWLSRRSIRVSQVLIKIDACRVRGCDIMLLDTSDIVLLDLRGCKNITDQCLTDIVKRCVKLRSIDIGGCGEVTDAGVTALGAGCGQLQSINLEGCDKVTDACVISLSAGCGQLHSIDLTCCDGVTDATVLLLSHIRISRY